MKRRIVIWVTFLAGLYYVLVFLLPPSFGGGPDSGGVGGATVAPGPAAPDGTPTSVLLYGGTPLGQPPRILSVPLPAPPQNHVPPVPVIAPSFARRDDYQGTTAPDFVPPDRLYYVGLGWDDRTARVCLARRADDQWRPEPRAVLDKGAPGAWDATGISWVSVLPPGDGSPLWRLWYVGRQGERGRVGFATSRDGLRWAKAAVPVLQDAEASIESISVLPWLGGERAWYVRRSPADPAGQLLTVTVSPVSGLPDGVAEPVAWQSPELRFGNIPREAIPILDARAVADSTDVRGVRLYITYRDAAAAAKDRARASRITLADNMPVLGERQPTTFIRSVTPLVSPGPKPTSNPLTDANPVVDDTMTVIGAFAVGLGLISLAQIHGRRVLRVHKGWPESLAFFASVVAMAGFTLVQRSSPGAAWGRRGYDILFYGLFQPLGSAMFSLLAAYLVSAAYRAFKVRSREAALMAIAAILIMLGQVPVGNLLTQPLPHYLQIPTIMAWVLMIANNAVIRAVNFGIFVGALATALRIWLSLDRAFHQMEV